MMPSANNDPGIFMVDDWNESGNWVWITKSLKKKKTILIVKSKWKLYILMMSQGVVLCFESQLMIRQYSEWKLLNALEPLEYGFC